MTGPTGSTILRGMSQNEFGRWSEEISALMDNIPTKKAAANVDLQTYQRRIMSSEMGKEKNVMAELPYAQ